MFKLILGPFIQQRPVATYFVQLKVRQTTTYICTNAMAQVYYIRTSPMHSQFAIPPNRKAQA
jgi:hypothetical protein